MSKGPQRIVCLSTETCETLYLLGEQARIVGISGFTVRPPQARKEKPKVSGFTSVKHEQILALKPDLVLGYCDLQAGMLAELAREGLEVHLFNQRDIAGILRMIETLGALVHVSERARALTAELQAGLDVIRASAASLPRRRGCIRGVERAADSASAGQRTDRTGRRRGLLRRAGTVQARQATHHRGSAGVVRRAPELIVGSWCGRRFRPEQVAARPGWQAIPAVRDGQLHEIKSPDILNPGPAVLTDGVRQLHA